MARASVSKTTGFALCIKARSEKQAQITPFAINALGDTSEL